MASPNTAWASRDEPLDRVGDEGCHRVGVGQDHDFHDRPPACRWAAIGGIEHDGPSTTGDDDVIGVVEQHDVGGAAGASRPMSLPTGEPAGVADAEIDASANVHPVNVDEVAHRLVEAQHAAGQHAVRGARARVVDDDGGVADRSTAPCGSPSAAIASVTNARRSGPSARHASRTIAGSTWMPVDDQPGDQRRIASVAPAGPAPARSSGPSR